MNYLLVSVIFPYWKQGEMVESSPHESGVLPVAVLEKAMAPLG